MKKTWIILIMIIATAALIGCCPTKCDAQLAQKVVTVDVNGLSPAAQAEIEQQMADNAITQKIKTYGLWAGMGKEIGIAAREGLTAVKDVSIELSESELGRTVMFLIVWKVAGIDMIRIIFGFIIIIVATIYIVKSYMRSFNPRRLVKSSGFFLFREKEYEEVDVRAVWGGNANRAAAQFFHPIVWLAIIGVSFAIMFA